MKQTIVNDFQELHRRAELSFNEFKTSEYIALRLSENNITFHRVASTGILAVIGKSQDPALLLRADMDALPINEGTGLEYCSLTPNIMHACGHDFHSAVLLNALILISQNPPKGRTIVGLFQPGEEVAPGGAKLIMDSGILDNYNIKYAIALHTSTELPTGTIGLCKGAFMASSDELHFTVKGTGGHAALTPQSENPIWRCAAFLDELSRVVTPQDKGELLLSIGRVEALGATNVIPEKVDIQGTLRTFNEQRRAQNKQTIAELVRKYNVENRMIEGYDVLYNNEELSSDAARIIEELPELTLREIPKRLTSEDFSRYARLYPSLMLRVGVTPEGKEPSRAHTPTFNADPEALLPSVEMLKALAFNIKLS